MQLYSCQLCALHKVFIDARPDIDDSSDRYTGIDQRQRATPGRVIIGVENDAIGQGQAIAMGILRQRRSSMIPGRSLLGNTIGRSNAPVANTTRPAKIRQNRSRG